MESIKPNVVIHTAALTNVDRCEEEMNLARRVNVEGTKNIVESCNFNDTFLAYISTDYVFSGDGGMYKETDKTKPINYYGLTKLEREKRVTVCWRSQPLPVVITRSVCNCPARGIRLPAISSTVPAKP